MSLRRIWGLFKFGLKPFCYLLGICLTFGLVVASLKYEPTVAVAILIILLIIYLGKMREDMLYK